jgi:hypothetical protein
MSGHRWTSSQLLPRHSAKGYDFPLSIMTGDESWFHHSDTKTKQQHGMVSHCTYKEQDGKNHILAGKIMGTERKMSMQFTMFKCSRNCHVQFMTRAQ